MKNAGLNETKQHVALTVEEHFRCVVTGCKVLGGGASGQIFGVAMNVPPFAAAVKVYATRGMQEREAFNLMLLNKLLSVPVPEVYFTSAATPEVPISCLCMELVRGCNVFSDRHFLHQNRARKERFAGLVADALISLHANTGDKFGIAEHPVFDNWAAYYKPMAEVVLRRAREKAKNGRFDMRTLDAMEDAWQRFDDLFSDTPATAVLIHGGLIVNNIMADPKTFLPTAFVGATNTLYADRDYELFRLKSLTGDKFGLYEVYKAKAGVSDKCDLKCAFYALWDETTVCLKAGYRSTPAVKAAAKEMRRQLAHAKNVPADETKTRKQEITEGRELTQI